MSVIKNEHQAYLAAVQGDQGKVWRQVELIYEQAGLGTQHPETIANVIYQLGGWRLKGVPSSKALDSYEELQSRLTPRPKPPPRTGLTSLMGAAFADDGGTFPALGITLMWFLWGVKNDPVRLEKNLQWAVDHGVDYIRDLAMVGKLPYWKDRVIDPTWSDYWERQKEGFELVLMFGLRREVVLFADAQVMMSSPNVRRQWVDTWATFVKNNGYEDLVQHWEICNEHTHNGIDLDEVRVLGRRQDAQTSIPVALSDTEPRTGEQLTKMYGHSGVQLATVHWDRDITKVCDGWRPVRKPWSYREVQNGPRAHSSNEPIGPGSSSFQEYDPVRIAAGYLCNVFCGGSAYVYHTSAGIRGQVKRDKPYAVVANYWDERNAAAIGKKLKWARGLLPGDLPNWTAVNHHWINPTHPFQDIVIWPDGHSHGVVRHYGRIGVGETWTMPMGVKNYADCTPSESWSKATVWSVDREAVIFKGPMVKGETYRFTESQGTALVIHLVK